MVETFCRTSTRPISSPSCQRVCRSRPATASSTAGNWYVPHVPRPSNPPLHSATQIGAVSALRSLGIVHGDIKPSNVLIDARGRAVLSDFGNAEDTSACTDGYEFWRSYVLSGTPPYMAPEVASADVEEKGYGATADVWSLGLVFLEIFGRFAGAYFDGVWTVEGVRAEHAKLGRKGIELEKVPLHEMPSSFEILLDSVCVPVVRP